MFRKILLLAASVCVALHCIAKIPVGVKSTISNAYGYIDENGEWAPGPMFRHARAFADSLGAVTFDGNHYCLINEFKQIVSEFVFPGVPYDGFNGLYSVKNSDGIVTLYNLNGEKPLKREFKLLKFDKGLIYGVEHGANKYKFFDGAGQPLGTGEYDRIQAYAVTVYPDGNRHSTFLFVGENGKSVDLLDANGEMIVSGLYDIRFAQEYYHIFSKAISKYNSKRKSAPEIDSSILDGIIIARPDGGKNYGVYLLTGRQLVDPKFKSAEKAAQEFEKKFEKVFVSLIKNGEYEHDMEQMVQKIEKSRADRSASNLAALNATKPVYASKMEVVYPMVLPEMTTVAAAKGKTRSRSRSKKNSKAAKTYYFSGNKKLESQKFAEIRNEGLQYVVRPVGSKKYKLYNLYGLPLSDEEYDEIVGWGYNKDGDHLFKVRQGKLWGVVSPLGVEILTPQFEKIELTGPEENVVAGKRDGMYYAINGQTAALINNQPYDEIGTAFAKDGLIPVVRGDFETKIDARGIEHPSQAEKLLDEKIAEAWSKRLPSEQINELVAPFSEVFKLCTPNDTHLGGKYMNFMGEYSYTVWDNLDLAQSLFESAVKQGYAQAANNLETVKKEKKRRKMQTLMNGLSALSEGLAAIGQSAESAGASYSGDEGGIPSATTGMSESTYRDIYSRWERNAKSAYESLTMQGSRTSRGGKATSGTANGYWRHHYSGLKRNLRTAQSEMRKTRQEARRAGFTINQSNYETVTVAN